MMMIMIPMITSKTIPEVLSKEVALIVGFLKRCLLRLILIVHDIKLHSQWRVHWKENYLWDHGSERVKRVYYSFTTDKRQVANSLYMSCRLFAHGHKISQLLFSGGNCQDHSFSFSFFYE